MSVEALTARPEAAWQRYLVAKQRAENTGVQSDISDADHALRMFLAEFVPADQREAAMYVMATGRV